MATVKGMFIKLVGNMMLPNEQKIANEYLQKELGVTHTQVEDEGWYDTGILDKFMSICVQHSTTKEYTYIIIGKKIYPTIKKLTGLPEHLKTPLDFIKFEAEGFLLNHQGSDVLGRKIIKAVDKEVVIQAKAPGYNSKLYEGVYLGILEMCGVKSGQVKNTGNDTFQITW